MLTADVNSSWQLKVYYAYFSHRTGNVLYAESSGVYAYSTFHGDLAAFVYSYGTTNIVVPIDVMTAVEFEWVPASTIADEIPYLTDDVKAAIRLVL